MNILQFQERAHRINKEKGFWEEGKNRNRGEMIALVIDELSEALEAHRKSITFPKASGKMKDANSVIDILDHKVLPEYPYNWTTVLNEIFVESVKDTVGDELCDTAVRLMDYFQGWEIQIDENAANSRLFKGNFGEDILHLIKRICNAFSNEESNGSPSLISVLWSNVFSELKDLCKHYNIDLEWHVDQKLRYNSTRPYKHNKAY